MNSRKKYPTLKKSTTVKSKEDLAKLHCVLNLFGEHTGDDPYFVRNIKEAIDASLVEEPAGEDSIETFAAAAFRLVADQPGLQSSYGLHHLDLRGRGFDPLFIREDLVGGLRKVAGYRNALIVVTGLREMIVGPSGYLTQKRRNKLEEATRYIDELAAQWTTDYTELSILYV